MTSNCVHVVPGIPRLLVIFTISALCLAKTDLGRADVIIFDNLNTPSPDSFLDVKFTQWDAQSFIVGNTALPLSLAELNMHATDTGGGNFFLRLYDNTGANLPGSVLETLAGTADPFNAGIYSYTGSTLLTANATYWIVAGVSAGSANYKWNFELPSMVEEGSTVGSTFSFNQGATWVTPASPLLTFNMRVSGVPEPSTLVLIANGVAILALLRWRNRRAA